MIFEKLKRHQNEEVKAGAEEPFHMIQAAIILNDTTQAVKVMHNWVLQMATSADGSPRPAGSAEEAIYVRFFANLLATWRHVGVPLNEVRAEANHVIHCYVRLLMAHEDHESIATYVAEIVGDPELQVRVYSDYLKRISDRDAQRVGLERAQTAGLPVAAITKVRGGGTELQNTEGHAMYHIRWICLFLFVASGSPCVSCLLPGRGSKAERASG